MLIEIDTKEEYGPDHEGVSVEDAARLRAAGYRPALRWVKSMGTGCGVICSTGEALRNIEIAEKQAKCSHVRRGGTEWCACCGALLPWGWERDQAAKGSVRA